MGPLKPGTNYCQCPSCKELFLSPRGFDRHRVGAGRDRACLSPPDMSEGGFQRVVRGEYEYWYAP